MKNNTVSMPTDVARSFYRFKEDLELAINKTPTGKSREVLTDLNILLGAWNNGTYKEWFQSDAH